MYHISYGGVNWYLLLCDLGALTLYGTFLLQGSGKIRYKFDIQGDPKAKAYHQTIRKLIKEQGSEALSYEARKEKDEALHRLLRSVFRETHYPQIPKAGTKPPQEQGV